MTHQAKASHVGTSLSMADLLGVLYGGVLRVRPSRPDWPDRDRMIVSKGHERLALRRFSSGRLFPCRMACQDGEPLSGHVMKKGAPGVELSTGSLGHGLPVGCGTPHARADARPSRVFVLLSDGECDEGSNWEAILFAGHHRLANLVAIVDYNKIQSFGTVKEVLDLEPFADKWQAFGWAVREIDGHDHRTNCRQYLAAVPFERAAGPRRSLPIPSKASGVPFMEDKPVRVALQIAQLPSNLAQALAELEPHAYEDRLHRDIM